MLATDSDIAKMNALISKQYNVAKDSTLEDFTVFPQWAASALKSDFKSIIICDKFKGRKAYFDEISNANLICRDVSKIYTKDDLLLTNHNTFYNILGEYNGRLIISFNRNWRQYFSSSFFFITC